MDDEQDTSVAASSISFCWLEVKIEEILRGMIIAAKLWENEVVIASWEASLVGEGRKIMSRVGKQRLCV